VTRAYEDFVATGGFVFRSRGDAARLHDTVKFHWVVAPVGGGEVAGVSLEIVRLDGTAASAPTTSSSRAEPFAAEARSSPEGQASARHECGRLDLVDARV
jgi:hypothetical protein